MTGRYVFAIEPIGPCLADTMEMWEAHYLEQGEEAARGFPLKPDIAQFFTLEKSGHFEYITSRCDGVLAGHFGLMISRNRQTSLLFGGDDFLYLKPEHRRGMHGIDLIKFARERSFARGAVEFGISFRAFGSVDITPLLKRIGFFPASNLFLTRR